MKNIFFSKNTFLTLGIPNQNSHKSCFEIGQWDGDIENHNEKCGDDGMLRFLTDPAQWPKFENENFENLKFQKTIRNAFNVYYDTARVLLEMICLGLGLDMEEFDKILTGHTSTYRLIHYPPRKDIIPKDCLLENGEIISTAEHHDTSIMTRVSEFTPNF